MFHFLGLIIDNNYVAMSPNYRRHATQKNIDHIKKPPNYLFDLRLPIPSLPKFDRLDLLLLPAPPLKMEPLFAEDSTLPEPSPALPTRVPSTGVFSLLRLWSAVAAADSAAVRDGFCIVPAAPSWSSWRCERCERRDFSWTDLNLSRRSTQRIEFSSRVFRRAGGAGRS